MSASRKKYVLQKMVLASSVKDALKREGDGEIFAVYVYSQDEKRLCSDEGISTELGFHTESGSRKSVKK